MYLLLVSRNGCQVLQGSSGNWVDYVKGGMVPVVGH